jgi:superfamily II DNA or RNA helicase
MARAPSLRGAPQWKRVLAAIESRERQERYAYRGERLRYDIDVDSAKLGGPLLVHVRRQAGEGEHVAVYPTFIARPFAENTQPPDDLLLTLLEGAAADPLRAPNTGSNPVFVVRPAVALEVLRRLAATGRAHVAQPGGAADLTAPPLAVDDGEPYDLVLDLALPQPGHFSIHAVLERDAERLAVDAPLVLYRAGGTGVALFRDRVARFRDGGQLEWAMHVRQAGPLPLAEADLHAFLEEVNARDDSPRVDLPEARAFEYVAVVPRPYVIFRTRAVKGISVELGLDYEGHRVHPYDLGHGIVDRANRRIIERDGSLEIDAAKKLLSLGATEVSNRFRIPKRELMDVARKVLALGWRVEIDGKLYRRASGLSLSVATGIDWLDVLVHADFDGAPLALPEMLAAIRQQRRAVVLSDGSIGEIPAEWCDRLARWSALAEPTRETLRFTKAQAGLVAALAGADDAVAVDAAFQKAREELRLFDGVEPLDPPASFEGALREYQRRALGWFAYLRRFGFGGCLADDMGLGKTVQVLALLEGRRGGERLGPSLVVVPRSLLYNWASEAARFAPRLRVLVHDGARRSVEGERFAEHDVVLTTYGLLRRDADALARVPFDYLVLDEAQAIKTSRSAAAKAARSLTAHHKLALTGTPIENHLGELSSLLEFLNPGVLGASASLTHLAEGTRKLDDEARAVLARGVRPFFLRRTKAEVAPELPARVEQTIYCELEPAHRKDYDELRDHYRRSLAKRIAADGVARSTVLVLEALLRLRQLACHPGLVARHRRGEPSAKLDALLEHLASARAEGHKALVFSQFTTLLGIVKARLEAQGVAFEYLDGKTKDRAQRVERFQTDPACTVFLLSLKAGGVGLNLPSADYVFLLDPWWNPASEAQAIDRAHRIGQTRTVFAYRLLARGTIEEKVEALQKEKRELAAGFFGEGGGSIAGLTRDDLEALLA